LKKSNSIITASCLFAVKLPVEKNQQVIIPTA